jgi:hypothetical protein
MLRRPVESKLQSSPLLSRRYYLVSVLFSHDRLLNAIYSYEQSPQQDLMTIKKPAQGGFSQYLKVRS